MPPLLESLPWPIQAGLGGPNPVFHCAPSYLFYRGVAVISLCLPKIGISWTAGVVLVLTKAGKSFQASYTGRIFKRGVCVCVGGVLLLSE